MTRTPGGEFLINGFAAGCFGKCAISIQDD